MLCPADLAPAHLPGVIAEAQVDTIVCDGTGPAAQVPSPGPVVVCASTPSPGPQAPPPRGDDRGTTTEWVLFTSGTTGRPKLVVHTLASLTGPLADGHGTAEDAIWSTFYDVRRYGGLQILLRAFLGGSSMVLSQGDETVAAFLARAGAACVTHISGTPSHWRRALMSSALACIAPRYVRLSGETADQTVLNHLAAAFPAARIAHAFASTEAGVAFEVNDGLAGFPAALIRQRNANAEVQVEDGLLRIRSARTARRYLGDQGMLADANGFVETGDVAVLRGDRYYFVGRRQGVINVGGQKVYPEEVEAIIAQHSHVQMARVRGRPSPITGELLVADIVLVPCTCHKSNKSINAEILTACRTALPPHKVPAMLRTVASLDIAASGKLVRRHA